MLILGGVSSMVARCFPKDFLFGFTTLAKESGFEAPDTRLFTARLEVVLPGAGSEWVTDGVHCSPVWRWPHLEDALYWANNVPPPIPPAGEFYFSLFRQHQICRRSNYHHPRHEHTELPWLPAFFSPLVELLAPYWQSNDCNLENWL